MPSLNRSCLPLTKVSTSLFLSIIVHRRNSIWHVHASMLLLLLPSRSVHLRHEQFDFIWYFSFLTFFYRPVKLVLRSRTGIWRNSCKVRYTFLFVLRNNVGNHEWYQVGTQVRRANVLQARPFGWETPTISIGADHLIVSSLVCDQFLYNARPYMLTSL